MELFIVTCVAVLTLRAKIVTESRGSGSRQEAGAKRDVILSNRYGAAAYNVMPCPDFLLGLNLVFW